MSRLRRRTLLGASALAAFPPRLFAQTATASRPRLLQGVQAGDVEPMEQRSGAAPTDRPA